MVGHLAGLIEVLKAAGFGKVGGAELAVVCACEVGMGMEECGFAGIAGGDLCVMYLRMLRQGLRGGRRGGGGGGGEVGCSVSSLPLHCIIAVSLFADDSTIPSPVLLFPSGC